MIFINIHFIFVFFRENERKQQAKFVESESHEIQEEILNDTILEMVDQAAFSVLKDTELERKSELSKIKENITRAKLASCFKQ